MIWPWNRKADVNQLPIERDSEAQRAQERARLAQREAKIDLVEMKARAERSREQRDQNNFAHEIWQAMKRRP